MMKPIPVTVLTGFLGAGKTTFLNDWLREFKQEKWAIIENEWGTENIDQSFIQGENQPVFPLTQGCICCTLNEEFYRLLGEIHQQALAWDGLLIETTGIADPAGVLAPFLLTPALQEAFPLARVICLIDPVLWYQRVEESEEIRRQAAYASVFVLTKSDITDPVFRNQIATELRTLFPDVPVLEGKQGDFPWKSILSSHSYEVPATVQQWTTADQHTSFFSSLTFRFETPFDINTLQWRLAGFLTFQAQDVWRMKGWVKGQDSSTWKLQTVGNQLSLTQEEGSSIESSVLVLIGKNLKRPGYDKFLKSCLIP